MRIPRSRAWCAALVVAALAAGSRGRRRRSPSPWRPRAAGRGQAPTLVGIAVRDGDLRLDDRVSTYVPETYSFAGAAKVLTHALR